MRTGAASAAVARRVETDIYNGVDVVWMPGDVVGKYTLGRPLARGGMAELHLATTPDSEQPFVLKRVRRDYADRSDVYVLFEREAALAATLHHPNIVEVEEVLDFEGDPVIVMEYLRGWDLRRILKTLFDSDQAMPLHLAVYVVQQALRGLEYAHDGRDADGAVMGVVHRDISPSNIFVLTDGAVKLLDFGIAKMEQATPTTLGASPKGKRAYMSPEQCRGLDVDRRADLFAIAAVLYEVTTMRRAFDGRNDMAVLHAILSKTPTHPTEVVDDYPPKLAEVVMKGLQREPEDRYTTARQMLDELQRVVEVEGLAATADEMQAYLEDLGRIERNLAANDGGRRRGREAATLPATGTVSDLPPRRGVFSDLPRHDPDAPGEETDADRLGRRTSVPAVAASVEAMDEAAAASVVDDDAAGDRPWGWIAAAGALVVVAAVALAFRSGRTSDQTPSAFGETPRGEPVAAAEPSSPTPPPTRAPAPVPEPGPAEVDDAPDWVRVLTDRESASALGFDARQTARHDVEREGRGDELDPDLLLGLDLQQAAEAQSPCAAAHDAIGRAADTEDERWVEAIETTTDAVEATTTCPGLRVASHAAVAKLRPKTSRRKPTTQTPADPPAAPATKPPADAKTEPRRHTVSEKLDKLRPPEL